MIPFVIATTGHRNIAPEAEDAVEIAVRSVLRGFADEHALLHTPLTLLSALAEGADQLVAQCALDLGIAVFAVLPLPFEEYSRTMSVTGAASMQQMLTRCSSVVSLPAAVTEPDLSEDARQAEAYRRLGYFLAESCQMLLALWDGSAAEKMGGTAEVVEAVLSGWVQPGPERHFREPQTGVVYQVVTPRAAGSTTDRAGQVNRLVGAVDERRGERQTQRLTPKTERAFVGLLQHLEAYNERAATLQEDTPLEELLTGLSECEATPFLQRIGAVSACADRISRAAARRRRQFLQSILITGAAATLGYAIADEVFHDNVLLWLILPLLLLIALVLHRFATRGRVDDLYLDCRALSEGLRVQFFWELAAIPLSTADFYLPHETLEIDWIRSALRTIFLFRTAGAPNTCSKQAIDFVLRRWIQDQEAWYHNRFKQQERYVARRNKSSKAALWLAIGYSIAVPSLLVLPFPTEWVHHAQEVLRSKNRPWYDLLHLPAVVATVWAGTVRIWTDQLGFVEQAREYRRIGAYFRRQSRRIAVDDLSSSDTREILLSIGKEALEENGRWLVLHRERPLEVDAG